MGDAVFVFYGLLKYFARSVHELFVPFQVIQNSKKLFLFLTLTILPSNNFDLYRSVFLATTCFVGRAMARSVSLVQTIGVPRLSNHDQENGSRDLGTVFFAYEYRLAPEAVEIVFMSRKYLNRGNCKELGFAS